MNLQQLAKLRNGRCSHAPFHVRITCLESDYASACAGECGGRGGDQKRAAGSGAGARGVVMAECGMSRRNHGSSGPRARPHDVTPGP